MEKSSAIAHRRFKFRFSISVYNHYLFYIALLVCNVMKCHGYYPEK